jgi:hypothetical protein
MLRKFKAKYWYMLGTVVFSNSLGIKTNSIWRNFHKSCQRQSRISRQISPSKLVYELKKDRLTVLSRQNVTDLARQVDNYFAESNDVYSQMPVTEAVKHSESIFKILKNAEQEVIDYYGSYFQPYWMQIQRTTPGKTTADSSFGWHMDDNPREMIKLFVYLNDVGESNGAFRAFSLRHSRRILLKGFQSNSSAI